MYIMYFPSGVTAQRAENLSYIASDAAARLSPLSIQYFQMASVRKQLIHGLDTQPSPSRCAAALWTHAPSGAFLSLGFTCMSRAALKKRLALSRYSGLPVIS